MLFCQVGQGASVSCDLHVCVLCLSQVYTGCFREKRFSLFLAWCDYESYADVIKDYSLNSCTDLCRTPTHTRDFCNVPGSGLGKDFRKQLCRIHAVLWLYTVKWSSYLVLLQIILAWKTRRLCLIYANTVVIQSMTSLELWMGTFWEMVWFM